MQELLKEKQSQCNINCFQTLKDTAERATENHMRQNNFDKLLWNLFSSFFFVSFSAMPPSCRKSPKAAVKLIETVQEVLRNSEEAGIFEN